jgi:uncharacterized protein with PIN domain
LATVIFRFYEELNRFLPPIRRRREFPVTFEPPVPVRHLMESVGVPHTEVEVILVNGRSVDLEQPLQDGDRVSVYPMFESLDVTPLLRLRERPLRDPRFLADAHLGKLARHLRMLGFDTRFENDPGDRELVRIAAGEGRILLTGDRALLMHKEVERGCHLETGTPLRQLEYLIARLDLCRLIRPFTRCMECNGAVSEVAREEVRAELPERVAVGQERFWRCQDCGRVYWRGNHYREMETLIARLCDPVQSAQVDPGRM